MDKQITTKIFLNKEYDNTKSGKVYVLTAPDGYSIERIMNIKKDEKDLFHHAGIKVNEARKERNIKETNISIGDIIIHRSGSGDEITYESDNEDEARRTYNILKARLGDEYEFLGHQCKTTTGEDCKKFKSQRKITE